VKFLVNVEIILCSFSSIGSALVRRTSKADPLKMGNVSKRFNLSSNRAKGNIAKDRFAFDQTKQGNDCQKIRQDGDFIIQRRDFFGNKVGEPTIYEVKTGKTQLTEAQEKRQRQMGRNRYKIARY
jgi:hypothetical protein